MMERSCITKLHFWQFFPFYRDFDLFLTFKINFHQNLGSKVNYVYIREFRCEFHSEYIKTTDICITLRS
jgi:hypothetical protein